MKLLTYRSTDEQFNPKPNAPSHLCHSLIDLLSQISPMFKKNFAILLKKRSQRHPFERVATPYQLYTWTAPMMEHTLDAIRAEDSKPSLLSRFALFLFFFCIFSPSSFFIEIRIRRTHTGSDERLERRITNDS